MTARLGPRATAAALFLFGLVLYLPGLGNHDLWNPDEPRYAEVAREMAARGDVLVPRLDGQVYLQKPPLFFWTIMAVGALRGGIDETAARLPSALAAAGATVLTWAIGRRLLSNRAGILAALALATNAKVLWQGRFGQIDMLLTFLVALGVYCWVRGYVERDPRWYPFFFVATGLATLAKGPAGFLPPLLSILGFLAITRDRASFRALGLGRGVLLWALIVAAWFVPASLAAGGGYASEVGLHQTLVRYFQPWLHQSPWYHYLWILPGDFFPWSLLLPTAAVVAWREARRGFLFAAGWALVTLVFFSLSPAKRGVYLLTMYPALALLVGGALDRAAATWPRYRAWVAAPLGALALASVAGATVALVRPPAWLADLPGTGLAPEVAALLAGLGAAAAAGILFVRRDRPAPALGLQVAALVAVSLVVALHVLPRFDAELSLRPVAAEIDRDLSAGSRYAIYPHLEAGLLFYGHHYEQELASPRELDAFLRTPGRRWLLTRVGATRDLHEPLPAPVVTTGPRGVENAFALFEVEAPVR